jgi:hypothetical protein
MFSMLVWTYYVTGHLDFLITAEGRRNFDYSEDRRRGPDAQRMGKESRDRCWQPCRRDDRHSRERDSLIVVKCLCSRSSLYIVTPTGCVEVMIVTSRETQRFITPKGWAKPNKKCWKSAEIEACEEPGFIGKIKQLPLETFRYWTRLKNDFALVE